MGMRLDFIIVSDDVSRTFERMSASGLSLESSRSRLSGTLLNGETWRILGVRGLPQSVRGLRYGRVAWDVESPDLALVREVESRCG